MSFNSFYWNKQGNWLWTFKYNFKTHVMSKKRKKKCKLIQLVELTKKKFSQFWLSQGDLTIRAWFKIAYGTKQDSFNLSFWPSMLFHWSSLFLVQSNQWVLEGRRSAFSINLEQASTTSSSRSKLSCFDSCTIRLKPLSYLEA